MSKASSCEHRYMSEHYDIQDSTSGTVQLRSTVVVESNYAFSASFILARERNITGWDHVCFGICTLVSKHALYTIRTRDITESDGLFKRCAVVDVRKVTLLPNSNRIGLCEELEMRSTHARC